MWPPDLALAFTTPKMPLVSMWNVSSTKAQNAQYQILLLNIDDPKNPSQPLPVEFGRKSYIKPKEPIGPTEMFGENAKSRIKEGHRLAGTAFVDCSDCKRHDYALYIKAGIEGWYTELDANEMAALNTLMRSGKPPHTFYLNFITSLPKERQIPLVESPTSREALPPILRPLFTH